MVPKTFVLLVTNCLCKVNAENADSELNLSQDEVLAQVHIPILVSHHINDTWSR